MRNTDQLRRVSIAQWAWAMYERALMDAKVADRKHKDTEYKVDTANFTARAANPVEKFSAGVGEDHLSADVHCGAFHRIAGLVTHPAPNHIASHSPADLLGLRPSE